MTWETAVWSIVMFDLPVVTKRHQAEATRFRNLLCDLGYARAQYSVYVRYVPTGGTGVPAVRIIRRSVPRRGRVMILHVTDNQWAGALRFANATQEEGPEAPQQLLLF